jgi:hypothetical protein
VAIVVTRAPGALAAVLALAACLGGCASGASDKAAPKASPSASASSAPTDGGFYSSSADLIAALKRSGVDCAGYNQIPEPANGALELGSCYVGGNSGGEIVVSIYASEADTADGVKALTSFGMGAEVLTGQNWTLNLNDTRELIPQVRTALGGRYLSISGTLPTPT